MAEAASQKGLDPPTFSCNNGDGKWGSPYHLFDYGLGELSAGDATPDGLEAAFVSQVPPGKQQVLTMPKATNVTMVRPSTNVPFIASLFHLSAADLLGPSLSWQ